MFDTCINIVTCQSTPHFRERVNFFGFDTCFFLRVNSRVTYFSFSDKFPRNHYQITCQRWQIDWHNHTLVKRCVNYQSNHVSNQIVSIHVSNIAFWSVNTATWRTATIPLSTFKIHWLHFWIKKIINIVSHQHGIILLLISQERTNWHLESLSNCQPLHIWPTTFSP